jgi:mono/diheme cytochrome c family protein
MRFLFLAVKIFAAFWCLFFLVSANTPKSSSDPIVSNWVAPKWADTILAPDLLIPNMIQNGKVLFLAQCSVCHGENGKGDGEAGFGLSVPPGDFTEASVLGESNGSLFWKIGNGRPPMPSYQLILVDSEVWAIVAYIRNLQRVHLQKLEKKNWKNKY